MSADTASQTVTFNIELGAKGLDINGKLNGGTVITVPQGWKVTITCKNLGSIPHSCAIVDAQGNDNIQFNASTPNPTSGMTNGQTQSITFTPDKTGTFRLACLLPGHEAAGMWATFTVAGSGSPSIQ